MSTFSKGKIKRKPLFISEKFKGETLFKDGVPLGTFVTPKDGGTFGIVETKHLNYLSKMLRKYIPLDCVMCKEYFKLNPVNVKWEYVFKTGKSAIVFIEYGNELDVYGYKDFDNDIKPILRTIIFLDNEIESENNFFRFLKCITEFNKLKQ